MIDQLATLPATPTLRREQINFQVALITPLLHVKGYAAPEPKAAAERARLLIEQAEALGEPIEDPLLLFSVLWGLFIANFNAFNGDVMRKLAPQFLALAERQGATAPLVVGHRMMGISLASTGDVVEGRAHFDRAITLYEPDAHRPLATRFSIDSRVSMLGFRSVALWFLGYPEAALVDSEHALKDAREIGQAAARSTCGICSAALRVTLHSLRVESHRPMVEMARTAVKIAVAAVNVSVERSGVEKAYNQRASSQSVIVEPPSRPYR